MIDGEGRRIEYLRLSVTDRCNCRCAYCMPESGVPMLGHADILSFEELAAVARAAAELGCARSALPAASLWRAAASSTSCAWSRPSQASTRSP